ncbi:tetratricopeptide repeat protein [bacterium]|nr:tetratricopeptide repeat protein [bacterium]
MKPVGIAIIFIFFINHLTWAQDMSKADTLFNLQKYPEALKHYEAIAKKDSNNAYALFRSGNCLQALGQYAQALKAYEKADQKGYLKIAIMLRSARVNALMQKNNEAFEWLTKAMNWGFSNKAMIENEADFKGIKNDERFKTILAKADSNAAPCAHIAEAQQFNFWVGEWDVKNPQGVTVGTSSITRILNDCSIHEHYTNPGGYIGRSFNAYNSSINKWQQFYVDNSGAVTLFNGTYHDNAMWFVTDPFLQGGVMTITKMTFYNLSPDHVRQFIENSTDDGKTWTTTFDGHYWRKK